MIFRILTMAAMAAGLAATPARAFDARRPADVLSVLQTNGASGELKTDDSGAPWIKGKVGKIIFEVNFFRCDTAKAACDLAIYQLGWDEELVNLEQVNAWNRRAFLCPAYLNSEKHPYAWYGVRTSAHDTREDVAAQQSEWLDCVAEFDDFTSDPDAFIKANVK